MFLATYGDVLTDAPLHRPGRASSARRDAAASPAGRASRRRPSTSCMSTSRRPGLGLPGRRATSTIRVNGGFFVLRQEIFDYLRGGRGPRRRRRCNAAPAATDDLAIPYDGFWRADGHAQGTGPPRGPLPARATAPGLCGADGHVATVAAPAARLAATWWSRLMLPVASRGPLASWRRRPPRRHRDRVRGALLALPRRAGHPRALRASSPGDRGRHRGARRGAAVRTDRRPSSTFALHDRAATAGCPRPGTT